MMAKRTCPLPLVLLFLISFPAQAQAQEKPARFTGPWDVPALLNAETHWTFAKSQDRVRPLFYDGVPYHGKPTRVFAYLATPDQAAGPGPFPAMLLVHGGGGKAFAEWADLWAKRGYVALAMDLSGRGHDGKRLPDGGPEQDDDTKFQDFNDGSIKDMWSYHAVAAVLKGHAVLASMANVDKDRIGITGISWGGYLTCIVAGIDDRLKVAVPVYGCGFLHEDSAWKAQRFDAVPADRRNRWVVNFDPSQYLPGVSCPTLFVNGTNDFAYPMGSYRKSYREVAAPRNLCVTVNMPHGHSQGWTPKEIGLFVDGVLKGGKPLARFGELVAKEGRASAPIASPVPLKSAQLHYTTDVGPWQKRRWTSIAASIEGKDRDLRVSAKLPDARPLTAFLTATDDRDATVSSEHQEIP